MGWPRAPAPRPPSQACTRAAGAPSLTPNLPARHPLGSARYQCGGPFGLGETLPESSSTHGAKVSLLETSTQHDCSPRTHAPVADAHPRAAPATAVPRAGPGTRRACSFLRAREGRRAASPNCPRGFSTFALPGAGPGLGAREGVSRSKGAAPDNAGDRGIVSGRSG